MCLEESVAARVFEWRSATVDPPLGRWRRTGGPGFYVVNFASFPDAPEVPWRLRAQERAASKERSKERGQRRVLVQKLLVGVSLHLLVIRKRYVAEIAACAQAFERRRSSQSDLSAPRGNTSFHGRPCPGPACSRARAAGLAGDHSTVGRLILFVHYLQFL